MRPALAHLFGAAVLALAAAACSDGSSDDMDGGTDADGGPPLLWQTVQGVPTTEDLLAVWGRTLVDADGGVAQTDLFAVGWRGTIVHWDGTQWAKETVTSTQPLTGISATPEPRNMMETRRVFAVGWKGTILERQADGTWSSVNTSTATNDLFDVHISARNHGLAVGDTGRVMFFNGRTWAPAGFYVPGDFSGMRVYPRSTLQGVWSPDENSYYIVGSGGATFRSSNGAYGWVALDTQVNEPLRGVWGSGGGNVFAVGLDSLILRFDGSTWRRERGGGIDELPRVFLFDLDGNGGDITIVGWRGVIVRHGNEGWVTERTDVTNDLRSVWIDSATQIGWAVGASGMVLRRDPPPPPDAGEPI